MSLFFFRKKISPTEIALFFRQFSVLISSGVPIIRSCDVLIDNQNNPELKKILQRLKHHLLAGNKLHSVFFNYTNYFNNLICHLIQISERTGSLDTILLTIANHLESKLLLKKQIQRALFYPCIIALMGVATTLSLLIFIIPRFAELFEHTENPLPFATRSLFSLSSFINLHLGTFFIMLVFLIGLLFHPSLSYKALSRINRLADNLPIIKTLRMHIHYARFARYLSMTLGAGIHLNEALTLSALAANSRTVLSATERLKHKINAGFTLHQSMHDDFPLLMTHLVEVGEESGKLTHMLDNIASMYESDASHLLNQLSQLLEPLIMVLLGALIGGVVICIYLPVFNLGNTL